MSALNLDNNQSAYQIRSYRPGRIQINEITLTHSLIVNPHQLIEPWNVSSITQLSSDSFLPILALNPEIVLLGTGATLVFPPAETYLNLIQQGIGIEIMDTSAASRTFNALSAENRNVVAALIV